MRVPTTRIVLLLLLLLPAMRSRGAPIGEASSDNVVARPGTPTGDGETQMIDIRTGWENTGGQQTKTWHGLLSKAPGPMMGLGVGWRRGREQLPPVQLDGWQGVSVCLGSGWLSR